jgi:hypothetical protein
MARQDHLNTSDRTGILADDFRRSWLG